MRRWKKEQKKWWDEDDTSSGENLPWDELQTKEMQVVLDEMFGMLFPRRANLSGSHRLSAQVSVSNSLRCSDLEIAFRDLEEKLLVSNHGRGGQDGKKRSFMG